MNLYQIILCFSALLAFNIGQLCASPSDYTYIKTMNSSYRIYQEWVDMVDWAGRISRCQSEGAVFFHPDDEYELEQVADALNLKNRGLNLNTGFSDLDQEGVFKTVDGRPLSEVYHKWDPQYTSRIGDHCGGVMIDSRTIFAYKCDTRGVFICKRKEMITATTPGTNNISATTCNNPPAAQEEEVTEQQAVRQDADFGGIAEAVQQHASAVVKLADALTALTDAMRTKDNNTCNCVTKSMGNTRRMTAEVTVTN